MLVVVGWGAWFFASRHAVPVAAFDQVEIGKPEEAVRRLLGAPQHIRQDDEDTIAWFYGGFPRGRWCTMEVFFDRDGRTKGKFHDH